jgi:hypothetical protein
MAVYRILAHLPEHRNVVDDRAASLRRSGNETAALVEAISRADPERQRSLAAWVARRMLARVGLDTHPDLVETLVTLSHRNEVIVTPAAELLIRRTLQEPGTGEVERRIGALKTLHQATNPDPHSAALDTVWYVGLILPKGERPAFYRDALETITS